MFCKVLADMKKYVLSDLSRVFETLSLKVLENEIYLFLFFYTFYLDETSILEHQIS